MVHSSTGNGNAKGKGKAPPVRAAVGSGIKTSGKVTRDDLKQPTNSGGNKRAGSGKRVRMLFQDGMLIYIFIHIYKLIHIYTYT